jgi:hypothetical protein
MYCVLVVLVAIDDVVVVPCGVSLPLLLYPRDMRLVVSLYNACTSSTLYLYSVTRSPTRLQHQAIWSPTRLQHQALNSRGTSISNILPRSQPSKIEIVLKI